MKTDIWVAVKNLGDGSPGLAFFNSREAAEKYMSQRCERYCDDIMHLNLYLTKGGKIRVSRNVWDPDPNTGEEAE